MEPRRLSACEPGREPISDFIDELAAWYLAPVWLLVMLDSTAWGSKEQTSRRAREIRIDAVVPVGTTAHSCSSAPFDSRLCQNFSCLFAHLSSKPVPLTHTCISSIDLSCHPWPRSPVARTGSVFGDGPLLSVAVDGILRPIATTSRGRGLKI